MHSIRRKRKKILKELFFFLLPYYGRFDTNMKIKTSSLICKVKGKFTFTYY